MEEVYQFLKKCGTYYLGTTDGDQPRVRPFGTVALYEGKLYLQTGRKKEVFRQMKENPKIEICAFDGERWLRVSATAVEDDRTDAQAYLLEQYPNLKAMYQPGDGNTAAFYLTGAEAVFSSFTAPPKTVRF